MWLQLHAQLIAFDHIITGKNNSWPHSCDPLGSIELVLYPGPDTRAANTILTEMAGSVGYGRRAGMVQNFPIQWSKSVS